MTNTSVVQGCTSAIVFTCEYSFLKARGHLVDCILQVLVLGEQEAMTSSEEGLTATAPPVMARRSQELASPPCPSSDPTS